MPHRQPPASQVRLNGLWQSEQAQGIRDRRAIETHAMGKLLLGPTELREELLIRLRLLHRVQVFAEEILDEGDLQTLRVGRLADHGGNPRQACETRSPPSALPRDELIARANTADDDRLNDARRPNRGRKF